MSQKKVIINADDLGLSTGCNLGIVKAMTEGVVTSTTLMINQGKTQEAIELLKSNNINKAGLHLVLSKGKSLMNPESIPSLVDKEGFFRKDNKDNPSFMDSREIKLELNAQIEKFLNTGLKLTHLDSHHHIHSKDRVLEVVLELGKRLNVPIRHTGADTKNSIVNAGLKTTDHISLVFFSKGVNLPMLKGIIEGFDSGVMEIMCHPAIVDNDLENISSYTTWREKELEILTSQEIKTFIKDQKISLIGYDKV